MVARNSKTQPAPVEQSGTSILPFGQVVDIMSRAFEAQGTAGLILVDGAPLEEIEMTYGADAFRRVIGELVELVRDIAGGWLSGDDCILAGELGSNEILILLFRPRSDPDFFSGVLPQLSKSLNYEFDRMRGRVGYPYLSKALRLPVGFAAALHNPILRGERQLYRLLEQARDESRLSGEVSSRRRRNALTKLVLAEDVSMVYQPIVDMSSDEVYGYEALVRPHAGCGMSSPDDLFDTGKETSLTFDLDSLCRRQGLAGATEIPLGAKLFLNCLPTAIHDPSFRGETLCAQLAEIGLRPEDLVLEISERESIENFTIYREARDYYAGLGVQVALDDTGAGYASLRAVMELSPNFIKLDHYLVSSIDTDPPRQELLRALDAVAKKIGATIIAEGIETEEELQAIKALGVAYGQGYHLGRPGPLPKRR